jgi:hypothetical protein
MGDPRRRHEVQHPFRHGKTGAQDRRDDQLLARDYRRLGGRHRRLDAYSVGGQVPSDFVAQQRRGLAHHGTEQQDRACAVTQDGKLVLHQGVRNDGEAVHFQNTVPSLMI